MKLDAALILLLLLPGVSQSSDKEDYERGKEMAIALSEKMASTYLCQNYVGGLNQYRAAKFDAIETYTHAINDRNKAVIKIDELEQKLKSLRPDKRIEETFDKSEMSELDRISFCQDTISEATDKVQLAKAKLGLL